VESEIARRVAANEAVIHIASHSFTPVFGGIVRRADVAWLYDPRRPGETLLARRWQAALAQRAPGLRLRRNYPYQGRSDGLASQLRKRHPDAAYVGIELEVNQRFVLQGGAPWETLRWDLVESLEVALSTPLRHRSA
jgi:predicted N-formylglutamate amidohydrolase